MPNANTPQSFMRMVALPERIGHECWEWTGQRIKFGYGRTKYHQVAWLAHRLAYTLFVEPIPDGLVVMHECDNPGCVRPGHLRLGTRADNNRDAAEKGRAANRLTHAARPTHCPSGHDYALRGRRTPRGKLNCLECDRLRQARRRETAA
jgi:hypothetical protein